MSWKFDAPTGTYRNFTLSRDIRREAIADAQFMKFLRPEPGYGKKRGESVTITRYLKLPLAARVGELDRLPAGRPPIETKQVTVSQWGYKVPVTEFEKNLTHFDIMNPIQATLRDQMTLTMDVMAAEAFKKTPVKYVPTTSGGTFTTNGSHSGVSDRNLGVADLRRLHDYLHGDLKAPSYRNGKYVGILSTKAARGLKNDPEYKDWIAPTSSEPLMTGRLKDIEGFALFETNHFDALDNTAGTSLTTGEAIFFAADAAGLLKVEDPEIRAGMPEELGTFQEVGWVGTLEAFLVWERASLARAIHVGSE
jgi:N4-gp56 family major capsid protein